MLQLEIDTQTTTKSGSATDALLWLKRALQFVQRLLTEVREGHSGTRLVSSGALVDR